jgi:hypothetical protein
MSVPSNLKMSVSPAFWRAVGDDFGGGAERERWGACAARGTAGFDQCRLTAEAAAQLLGLEGCQLFRLLKAYRTEGPADERLRRGPEAIRRRDVDRKPLPHSPRSYTSAAARFPSYWHNWATRAITQLRRLVTRIESGASDPWYVNS